MRVRVERLAGMIWALRRVIDLLDVMLRWVVRLRSVVGRLIVRRKDTPTDASREQEILDKCRTETERAIYRRLFAASKTGVQRSVDGGD
jgi:hypothetical protein